MATEERSLSVVLSGGGCKTFWSMGVLERVRALLPPVAEWAGVSAGAAMAAALAADRVHETMEYFCARTDANRSNAYPSHLFTGERVFPHEAIYRDTILEVLADGGFEALRAAAPLRILLVSLADGAPPLRTILGAARAYRKRKKAQEVHGPTSPHPGFRVQVVTAQDCATPAAVCDAILASSCTPPITAVQVIDGRRYADGALVDHAPVRALTPAARRGRVLVLTTMSVPREALPAVDGRLYLAPSRELPIEMWDYANPDKVRQAYDLGYEDGEGFLRSLEAFLETSR